MPTYWVLLLEDLALRMKTSKGYEALSDYRVEGHSVGSSLKVLYGQLARQGLVAWGKVMLYEVWSGYKM